MKTQKNVKYRFNVKMIDELIFFSFVAHATLKLATVMPQYKLHSKKISLIFERLLKF